MTQTETPFMGANSQVARPSLSLGVALAAMLRARFPQHTTKNVARSMGCTPKAAENLLDGHLSARTLTMLIEAFGPGFVAEAVMAAAGTNMIAFIRAQADQARAEALRHQEQARELAQIEADIRSARRPVDQGGVGLAP